MRTKTFSAAYHLMLLPGILLLLIFHIIPMFGIAIAFQKFVPAKGIFGSRWVGLDNFNFMFQLSDSRQIFFNTILIAALKIIAGLAVPIILALLLNAVRIKWFKRSIQTIIYVPHFLSWVVLAGMIVSLVNYDGIINMVLVYFGHEKIVFLTSNIWFRPILIISQVWKEAGFGTIIYLAALTAINPNLYESAGIDGASRFKQLLHVTLPGIQSTIVLLATLSLGNILNAGFDQIFNMYNPIVYETADIIDTYVYRVGLISMQYGLATAVGLLKSVVSLILIVISYKLAYKFSNYRIF